VKVRDNDPIDVGHIRDFWKVLFTKIRQFTYANGGNIIMVQIENEFAYHHTCDKHYLQTLADIVHEFLGEIQLYTTDGASQGNLKCGNLKGKSYGIVDFPAGTNPTGAYHMQRNYNGGGPYSATEVWPGWFDNWGGNHHRQPASSSVFTLEKTLQMNGSLNFYMYIGGTNFGFTAGSTITTSYDYDAHLSEAGDMTWKYQEVLALIKKYRPTRTLDVKNSTKKNYGKVTFREGCSIFEAIDTLTFNSTKHETPIVMEELNVGYGFAVYRSHTNGGKLNCPIIADRGNILVDQKRIAIQTYGHTKDVDIPSGTLDILVENQGRGNGGFDHLKGLEKTPTLNGQDIKDWTSIGLDTDKVRGLPWKSTLPQNVPGFYRAKFQVDSIGDTFLNPTGWTRGIAWINGFNLGRYWLVGPQITLYIPAGVLKVGENELIVFELEHTSTVSGTMTLDDVHRIG
jgi:beta-galactosidase